MNMDNYITGSLIKKLRENNHLTQEELADRVCVSSKAISKWETGRGFPGVDITNKNRSSDMKKCKFYVCPVCGNAIQATGEAVMICCGIILPPLEAEEDDCEHPIGIEIVEDEYYVTVDHPMTKTHYISFLAAVSDQTVQFTKLYPEGDAATRFKINRVERIYAYCNRHGLFGLDLRRKRK